MRPPRRPAPTRPHGGSAVPIIAAEREPPCPHFGRCGGCALQHLGNEAYENWKLDRLREALRRHRLDDTPALPLVRIGPGTRRRAEFAISRAGGAVSIGFHARQSRDIIDIEPCPVLLPSLVALLPALREGMRDVLRNGERGDLYVAQLDGGADALLTLPRAPDRVMLEALAAFAASCDLARLAWRTKDEPATVAAERRRPRALIAAGERKIAVAPPPGAFLQPSEAGERAMIADVLANTERARRVLDLYAGCGTFALALAASDRKVHAVEGDGAMASALTSAARDAGLGNAVTVATRDLKHRPLLAPELAGFDAIVFDPPFAGAREQAAQIAQSKAKTVIGVSCNPATFARDARLLVDGGYRLVSIRPIDQFLWSTHLEVVGVFARE